ncbi:MAG: hypothetical protein WA895_20090 [Streptosporangiaceae bacterium]
MPVDHERAAFSATGLFAGLSGLFLATTLHDSSHALNGATLFVVFRQEWWRSWQRTGCTRRVCSRSA